MRPAEQIQAQWHELMQANHRAGAECGASVVLLDAAGEVLCESHLGYRDRKQTQAWSAETLVPIYSASKGIAALTLLHALCEHGLEPSTPLSRVWPRLSKSPLSIAELLCHQAGLAWLEREVSVFDYEAVIEALEAQQPAWGPPRLGYHPRTWGFLVDELTRKITSLSLHNYFEQSLRPLAEARSQEQLDFWFSLPEQEHSRVAELLAGKAKASYQSSEADQQFYAALSEKNSPSQRAFASPQGLHAVSQMNQPKAWETSFPAFGAVASASGLARLYALFIAPETLQLEQINSWVQTHAVQGADQILLREMRFSCGFQQDPLNHAGQKIFSLYGNSKTAFGHPGAGGSHAFVDPQGEYAFAYVMNQMELSVLPGKRARDLVQLIDEV